MKKQIKKYKNLKISVHIPLYLETTKKKQFQNFRKVCDTFLKLSEKVKIFVHTNKKLKNHNKKIKFFYYDFKRKHPHKLTWYCRKLMETQKNNYDIFIYCEDDIYFSKKNFQYWINHKDICINNKYNLGFLRFEIKDRTLYAPDQVSQSKYYINLKDKKYVVIDNPHCAFWIYDKAEFNKFIKTKYFKFNWKWTSISGILLIREMASIGWHGVNMNGIDMGQYLSTMIPLKNKKLDSNSFVRHLSDNFSQNPAGLFGTFKVKDILKKDLKEFKPITPLKSFLKRTNYLLYSILRINIKKYK